MTIELMDLKPQVLYSVDRPVQGVINKSPSSMTLLISINGMSWQSFSKSTVAHAKMDHVSQTMPLSEVICHPFGRT